MKKKIENENKINYNLDQSSIQSKVNPKKNTEKKIKKIRATQSPNREGTCVSGMRLTRRTNHGLRFNGSRQKESEQLLQKRNETQTFESDFEEHENRKYIYIKKKP